MAPPDYPIKVGSMLYTLVDPHEGHEVAYNRWYERDHFYGGCMTGPWCFAGSRWVATRELKDMRFPVEGNSVNDPVDRGSYVAIYWVEAGHHGDHFAWGADQVVKLYTAGRGFNERTHAHTASTCTTQTTTATTIPFPSRWRSTTTTPGSHRSRSSGRTASSRLTWMPGWPPRAFPRCSRRGRSPRVRPGPPCPATT